MRATTDSRPSIERLAMAMRPLDDDEQRVGRVVLVEQHVAPPQVLGRAGIGQVEQLLGRQVGEQVDVGEQVGGAHHLGTITTSRRVRYGPS